MLRSPSHIVPVIIGDPDLCKTACDELLHAHRIYVQPIKGLGDVWRHLTLRKAA
jgi:7-keto-8-aminopelargonate synthetase-like enzyme